MYIDGRNYHQPEIRATFIQTLHFWMAMKVRTGGGCSCREVKMDEVKSMNTVSQQSSGSTQNIRCHFLPFVEDHIFGQALQRRPIGLTPSLGQ